MCVLPVGWLSSCRLGEEVTWTHITAIFLHGDKSLSHCLSSSSDETCGKLVSLWRKMAKVHIMFPFKNRLKRKGQECHIVFLAVWSHVLGTTAFSLLCLCVLPRLYGACRHVKAETVLYCISSTQQKKTPNSEKKVYGIFTQTNCGNPQRVLSHHSYKQANCLAVPHKHTPR